MLCYVVEHGAEVLHINQQKTAFIGYTEYDVQYTFLDFGESEKTGEQLGSHIGDSGTHRMTLFTEHVEKTYGALFENGILYSKFFAALFNESVHGTGLADPAQVTFHVGHETGNASLTESFGKNLQGDGLSRSCGSCNQTVPVSHLSANRDRTLLAVSNI
jgi:hypothetical protein